MAEKKNRYAVALGRKGGKAGRGKSQVRGDSEYYRDLRKKAWEKKKAEQA